MYFPIAPANDMSGFDLNAQFMIPSLDDVSNFSPPDYYQHAPLYTYPALEDLFQDPQPSRAAPSPPSDGVERVPCLWGNNCHILLDDVSAAGLMRHVKEYHLRGPWNKKTRGICEWGGRCGKDMAYASFGKHVAVVHMRSSVKCPHCQRDVRRAGLLERHIRDFCPANRQS